MIKIPFNSLTFGADIKSNISAVNLGFEFENIESSLIKAAVEIRKVIGPSVYDKILELKDDEEKKNLYECLQKAMLHLAFYNNLIFIAVKIDNDGITTKKNNNETTAYKYQTDELKFSLIETAWFWLSALIEYLDSAEIDEWNTSDKKKAIKDLIINSEDLQMISGINSTYFFWKISPIIRRVIDKEIKFRIREDLLVIIDSDSEKLKLYKKSLLDRVKEAIINTSLSIAVKSMSQYEIPGPLRANVDNEMTKSTPDDESFRTRLSNYFAVLSKQDFTAVESIVRDINNLTNIPAKQIRQEVTQCETDKFILT